MRQLAVVLLLLGLPALAGSPGRLKPATTYEMWLPALAGRQLASAGSLLAQGAYKAPRTPDGQPDLQGYWTNLTYTPLERPAALGTKAMYTE